MQINDNNNGVQSAFSAMGAYGPHQTTVETARSVVLFGDLEEDDSSTRQRDLAGPIFEPYRPVHAPSSASATCAYGDDRMPALVPIAVPYTFTDNTSCLLPSYAVDVDSSPVSPALSPTTPAPPLPTLLDTYVQFATTSADFMQLPWELRVSKSMQMKDLRSLIFNRIQAWDAQELAKTGDGANAGGHTPILAAHHNHPSCIRLRVPTSGCRPPGDILRDGLTVEDALPIDFASAAKAVVIELRNMPEELPERQLGDVLVYVQRWFRSAATLGPRQEVYLPGGMSVQYIAMHLAAMFSIPPDSLYVNLIDKLSLDIPLYALADPSSAFSRAWISLQSETGYLKNARSKGWRLTEGDLLLLQDCTEPVHQWTSDELNAIRAAAACAESGIWGTDSMFMAASSAVSHGPFAAPANLSPRPVNAVSASDGVRTRTPAYGSGGGGVKIKTHKHRVDEALNGTHKNVGILTSNSDPELFADQLYSDSTGEQSPVFGPSLPAETATASSQTVFAFDDL